ncbi:MAG: hypothetical protein RMK29_03855 [Myxococcales bacterium]|nr:lamin tail domain-containing protein [Myxococcota bacterium]MDW8280821.1 hypothetical protein [Myxococcales bacterium]
MPLVIRELHPAPAPGSLNEEWILVENTGPGQVSTAGCTLWVSTRGRKGRRRLLGTLDPGFLIRPGEKVRLVTGSPAKQGQGTPPPEAEGVRNYHLFLREPVLHEPGVVLHLLLNQMELCAARFAPQEGGGVGAGS